MFVIIVVKFVYMEEANYYPTLLTISKSIIFTNLRILTDFFASSGPPQIPCGSCDKLFSTEYKRNFHVTEVHAEKNFFCEICGTGFTLKGRLTSHIKLRHGSGTTQVQCDLCGKSMMRSRLSAHILTHSNTRLYECPVCPMDFKTSGRLQIHMFKHTDTNPYNCHLCGAGYCATTRLQAHYTRKHGISYTCDEVKEHCKRGKHNFTLKKKVKGQNRFI